MKNQMDKSIKNPWSGRFSKNMTKRLVLFNTSLPIEERLFEYDIKASIGHVEMLYSTSLLTLDEKNILKQELERMLIDWQNSIIKLDPELEDIHMNIETILTSRVGELGKKVHTGRSRNDQQAVAQRLFFKESTQQLIDVIRNLQYSLLKYCKDNKKAIMPSYTHLQRAEFTSFSHWLSTYIVMLDRDKNRLIQCLDRADECPLGACASTGTSLPIDRDYVAKYLGFKQATIHSIDSVSDRDYLLEFASCSAILMMHLSRLSEEIIIFNSQEFKFIELDDGYCTGSSIMPQKKNPDVLELIRGKSSTVLGNAVGLLTLVKSLSLGYNKDFQEDKYSWFSALDNSISSVMIMGEIIETMKINKSRMKDACREGHIIATEYANYLVRKGVSFREAHRVVGCLVKMAESKMVDLSDLKLHDLKSVSELFSEDIKSEDIESLLQHKNSKGSSGDKAIEELFVELELLTKR